MQTSELGVTEHIEGDECKFAVWTGRAPISDLRIVLKVGVLMLHNYFPFKSHKIHLAPMHRWMSNDFFEIHTYFNYLVKRRFVDWKYSQKIVRIVRILIKYVTEFSKVSHVCNRIKNNFAVVYLYVLYSYLSCYYPILLQVRYNES